MKYDTIEDGELTPLYSDDAAPSTKNKRTFSVMVRAVMVGTIVGALLMASHSMMMPNSSSNVDSMVVVSSAASPVIPDDPCVVAVGAFSGKSKWARSGYESPFESCWQATDNGGNDVVPSQYCWTQSYLNNNCRSGGWVPHRISCYNPCNPLGGWHILNPKYVNPVTTPNSCGPPCGAIEPEPYYG